jgi:hypothetical protein
MNSVIKWALILAGAIAVMNIGLGATNTHLMLWSIPIAIVLNVVCVVMGLKGTAADAGYGKQLLNSAILGLVAGVPIFIVSWLCFTMLFGDYLAEDKTLWIEFFESTGMPEEAMTQQISKMEARTPFGDALSGLIGTFVTSLVIGAIAGIFLRKK